MTTWTNRIVPPLSPMARPRQLLALGQVRAASCRQRPPDQKLTWPATICFLPALLYAPPQSKQHALAMSSIKHTGLQLQTEEARVKLIVTVAANGQAVDDPVSSSLLSRVCGVLFDLPNSVSLSHLRFSFVISVIFLFQRRCRPTVTLLYPL